LGKKEEANVQMARIKELHLAYGNEKKASQQA
jgi:hypothetical protein